MKGYIDFPNEVIEKCVTKKDGLTYDALGFLFYLKLRFKNHKIKGTTCVEISKESGINVYTVKKYLPILLNNGLLSSYRQSTVIYSDNYIKKTFGNVAIRNIISLDGCKTIKDFSARIKLSLVLRKVNQIEYSFKESLRLDSSPFDLSDDSINTYLCIGTRKLAKEIGCSSGGTNRLLLNESKKGGVELKHIFFDYDKIPIGSSLNFTLCTPKGKTPIAHFGSIIKVNCVYNFCEIENKIKIGTILYKVSEDDHIVSNDHYSKYNILINNKIKLNDEYSRVS